MRKTAAILTACLLLLFTACGGGQRESVQETENSSATADVTEDGRELMRNCFRFFAGTNTVKSGWITARLS